MSVAENAEYTGVRLYVQKRNALDATERCPTQCDSDNVELLNVDTHEPETLVCRYRCLACGFKWQVTFKPWRWNPS
uniref:TFIIS-type domain-containing protein n=1 Tax=viral metagenome TaxID=1070528 RepID=A0A6M3L8F2_9ZZZZ